MAELIEKKVVMLGVKLWNKDGHVAMKGAPSDGIELVLRKFLFR
jgi:hypothetical protein